MSPATRKRPPSKRKPAVPKPDDPVKELERQRLEADRLAREGLPQELSQLTAAQIRLAAWLAMPEGEREPQHHSHLAIELGIRPETISVWKRNPLIRQLKELLTGNYAEDVRAEFWGAIKRGLQHSESSYIFAELYARLTGLLQQDPHGALVPVGASAGAAAIGEVKILQVFVDGQEVDDAYAREAAARKLLDLHTERPQTQEEA